MSTRRNRRVPQVEPTPGIPTPRQARAALAGVTTNRPDDEERITEARRDLHAANLAAFVSRTLATAPVPTVEQRAAIAQILMGGGAR